MKNYLHKYQIAGGLVFEEVTEEQYTDRQKADKEFIDMLAAVVVKAKCGWDDLRYKVIKYEGGTDREFFDKFMVLCADDREVRWIPITGNSMGCNLQVLGENLW
jgi:hypothetical protein